MIPGIDNGTMMRHRMWNRLAPSMTAASSRSVGMSRMNCISAKMTKGLAYQGKMRPL